MNWRRSSSLALALSALLAVGAAARNPRGRVYDPEVALLALTVQKEGVKLVRDELERQAEWLGLGAMRVVLKEQADGMTAGVLRDLTVETDVLDDYRRRILHIDPTAIGELDKLVAEIRRYHDLAEGPPLERVPVAADAGKGPDLLEEDGVGRDVSLALRGDPVISEPVAYAERRFGSAGPFLRRRLWNLDFYLGSLDDLVPHYRGLGYRRFYRLRAPYIGYGKQAWVLAPEPGLRPRLVFCAFFGRDLFAHTRAQYEVLTEAAKGRGPIVRTLTCPTCKWELPGVRAMKSLVASSPYTADNAIVGYDYLFEPAWAERRLGVYENEHWRLAFYRTDPSITVVVQPRHTYFGEILAEALDPLVRRGAKKVFYAGPAAPVNPKSQYASLILPSDFMAYDGRVLPMYNSFLGQKKGVKAAGIPSPLFATKQWLDSVRKAGAVAFDGETTRLAEIAARWALLSDGPAECGIGLVGGSITSLHPEEDRSSYTVEYAGQIGRESAKRQFRDMVLARIGPGAR